MCEADANYLKRHHLNPTPKRKQPGISAGPQTVHTRRCQAPGPDGRGSTTNSWARCLTPPWPPPPSPRA